MHSLIIRISLSLHVNAALMSHALIAPSSVLVLMRNVAMRMCRDLLNQKPFILCLLIVRDI